MPKAGSRAAEWPDKVWLSWTQEGPFLVRHQHLVAADEEEPSLCSVPIGKQVRGLAKATLEELRAILPEELFELARQVADRLVQGRPYRLIVRELQARGHSAEELDQALMALCRAGLVVAFCRNRRRHQVAWEVRHAELTNWGRAVLISLDAVTVPAARAPSRNGAEGSGRARTPARRGRAERDGRSGEGT